MYENLAVIAVFLLCFSLVAGRLQKTIISGPMVYVGFGFVAGPLVHAGEGVGETLASIVFAIIVLNYNLPDGDLLAKTVVYTVLMSVIAHGLTANPLARWIGRKVER